MAQKIYIAATEKGSGKTLVAIGLLNALRGIIPRVGYMKPVGQRYGASKDIDEDALLMKEVFGLLDDPRDINPMSMAAAQDKRDVVFEKLFSAYERIAVDKDVVVIEGTDYTSTISALEFDINAQLAKNMVAPVLLVANGWQKSTEEVAQNIGEAAESLAAAGCDLLGAVVNRCDSSDCARDSAEIRRRLDQRGISLFGTLQPSPMIAGPRLMEVAERLGASVFLRGDDMSRVVTGIKVLAMTAENALRNIKDQNGWLLITPGDRLDNIFAAVLAQKSLQFPRYSGLVLTGGLVPGREARNLLKEMKDFGLTILSVKDDTYQTALRASSISGQIRSDDREKLELVCQLVERHIDIRKIHARLGSIDTEMVTPAMFQYQILQRAKANRRHIALPEGTERRIIQAAAEVVSRGICDVTLLGSAEEIRRQAGEIGVDISQARVVDPVTVPASTVQRYADKLYELRKHKGVTLEMARDQMLDPIYFATMMVYMGDADGFVSGAVHSTADTLGPALRVIKTRPGVSLASSLFFMLMPNKVVVYADCALVQNPNAAQLADIAITSADTARSFGIEPYVAMLSYSTGRSGTGQDVEKVREATRIAREKRPDLPIEGPIQYDAAVSAEVARIKVRDSEVAGRATVYIFPDLDAGNTAYKAVQRSANVPAIGPIMQGLAKPANDLSRGALVIDIVYTIAITAIQAQQP